MNKAVTPKVSVVSVAYNQEKYIRETLESFVTQQTNFEFEVVIADDCSTDRTPQIIEEYAKAYPEIFRPIFRKKNIGVLQNFLSTIRAAKGDYIALCEGDDYWTDPEKLQKQVAFLDSNPKYALCFHPVRVIFENKTGKEYIYPEINDPSKFTTKELLQKNFIQTNAVMYRRQQYKKMPDGILPIDWYLHLYHAQFGKIGFIDKVMATYRKHPGGIWWDASNDIEKIWEKYGVSHLGLFVELQKLYGKNPEYRQILIRQISSMFERLIRVDDKNQTSLAQQALGKYPQLISDFFVDQYNLYQDREQAARSQISQLEHTLAEKNNEIQAIKSSKFWRLRNKLAKFINKPTI